MPAEQIQAPIFAKPQEDLRASVDAARQASISDEQRYHVMHDHFKGNAEMTEFIGDSKNPAAPRLTVEQHRIDAKEGHPGSEEVHAFAQEDPITGDVNTGLMVTGQRESGENYSHIMNTHPETVQHIATLIAQKVTREAEEANATHLEELNHN